jgi:iron complex transport system substrate-binding protein
VIRVVSLLPAATEIVAALGAEDQLVGVSHECDYPPSVRRLPRVTATPIDPSAPSAVVDDAVRALRAAGTPVIGVDRDLLRRLRPDLLLTQDLCDVCAVGDGETTSLAGALDPPPRVLTLKGRTLDGVWEDVRAVGRALEQAAAANALVARLAGRLARLRVRIGAGRPRPRVACVEWLAPLYLAGHWVPELVEAAGGEDVGARPGAHSRTVTAGQLAALRPDLIVVMLCGMGLERALAELKRSPLPDLGTPVWVLDGNAYTSRPGPRLPEGAERIAAAIAGRPMEGLAAAAAGG